MSHVAVENAHGLDQQVSSNSFLFFYLTMVIWRNWEWSERYLCLLACANRGYFLTACRNLLAKMEAGCVDGGNGDDGGGTVYFSEPLILPQSYQLLLRHT